LALVDLFFVLFFDLFFRFFAGGIILAVEGALTVAAAGSWFSGFLPKAGSGVPPSFEFFGVGCLLEESRSFFDSKATF
jgi:hypothetical protein